MKHSVDSLMKRVQTVLGILIISAFAFLMIGEAVSPPDNGIEEDEVRIFQSNWKQRFLDGKMSEIEVPGECETKKGEWVTIVTQLPEKQAETWICMRSSQQEVKVFVDGSVRKEYSTLDTQPFGKTSTMAYVFFPLYDSDAGKELCIEFRSDSAYAGYVSDMYEGDRYDIIKHMATMYAPSAIVAGMLLLIGLFVVFGSIFVKIVYKIEVDLLHLGTLIVVATTWLLVESKLRQFIFSSSTIAMLMGFLMIALLPYPVLAYVNSVQGKQYQKIYLGIAVATMINYIVVVVLQVFNIKDFFEVMTSSHIICIVLIVTMAVTFVLDIKSKRVNAYKEVAIGFGILMLGGICEIVLVYKVSARWNGIFLCIGLVCLLITAALKTSRDLFNLEKEKQIAIATSDSRAQFLANMSHEIRTPINTIIGMNEMILCESKEEKTLEYAGNVKNAGKILISLINDILDLSKMDAGKLQIVEKEYVTADMLRELITGIEMQIGEKKLEFKTEIDENIPSVLCGDEIRIRQILTNFLTNAIKYTEKGSVTFSVFTEKTDDGVYFKASVADTGMGIKQEDIGRLFDGFQRLDLMKNHHIQGTGLGLNITRQLVELMNGHIDVKSDYGKGSCFSVSIPQRVLDEEPIGNLSESKKKQENRKPLEKLKIDANILVVDDTKMNLTVIKALLGRTGAKVETALSGTEGIEKSKKKKYDLILMDHMMPEPDGIESFHRIREDEQNPNSTTPVIVLTANAIAGMKEEYLKEGFSDYLSKPVDVDVLEEMLCKYILGNT